MSDDLTRITALLGDLEEEGLLEAVDESLSAGADPLAVVEACRAGMEVVGKRFSEEEYFVSELICSAELFQGVMEKATPLLSASDDEGSKTKVVFGTVKDDIHDIGKDIVIAMLRCSGFEVYDLGINVPPEEFVKKVKETDAKIVGMSGLLTIAFSSMEETIKALKNAGLEVKTMIGGGMTNDMVCEKVGADGWGRDAMEAVNLVKTFSEVS
ncbi:MAG: cobalamin-dependent protein [Dehalococcoidales bacterium]|nr:MAG: cobalamin-dependent protein [Dehalococcoidales bacterium]